MILFLVENKISLDILYEVSVKQIIHVKCQEMFSVKNQKFSMLSAINFLLRL